MINYCKNLEKSANQPHRKKVSKWPKKLYLKLHLNKEVGEVGKTFIVSVMGLTKTFSRIPKMLDIFLLKFTIFDVNRLLKILPHYLLQECNLSANADYDDFHLKCRKDIRFWEIDEPIDRQKLFHKFLKDLTTPEDSVRERKEVQEEDKEEVEASQQEKHKEAAEESQRPMDNCK